MLYLFSSNAQPQYSQDILNVIAAPTGYRTTFRYDAQYLNDAAAHSWDGGLVDEEVLIHFVLQQPHEYFIPVIFPVRRAKVVGTRQEGRIHLVDFVVGDVVSLKPPETRDKHAAMTAAYRKWLASKGMPLPYERYAILSAHDVMADRTNAGVISTDQPDPNKYETAEVFRQSTEYLAYVETFSSARFAYVARLIDSGKRKPVAIDESSHAYRLTAGEEYELEFLQAQPTLVGSPSAMNVILDGATLQAIGPTELAITSRYDVQSIRMFAAPITGTVKHTTIGLRPDAGLGPILDIPVEIRGPLAKNIGVAVGTATSVVLLGLASILSGLSSWQKFGLVAAATLSAALLNLLRLSTKTL